MKGRRVCKCRDDSGKEIGAGCPKLRRSDGSWSASHGTWYGKKDIKGSPAGKRLTLRAGGFATQEKMSEWFAAAEALLAIPEAGPAGFDARVEIMAVIHRARAAGEDLPARDDILRLHRAGASFRTGTTGDYLLSWIAAHKEADDLAATTFHNYERTVHRLFLPAFGDVPLIRLTTGHVLAMLRSIDAEADRIRAARASEDPEVRASVRGQVPPGDATKRRYLAVLRSALADASSGDHPLIAGNPAAAVKLGKKAARERKGRTRAKLWTTAREQSWREGYEARRAAEDSPGAMRSFQLWRSTSARPGPVMIWTPAQLGRFLDAAEGDRLYPMLCLICHCGLRRGEAVGLRWEDVDLDGLAISVLHEIVQIGWRPVSAVPKSDASLATVRTDPEDVATLRAWRRAQLVERVAWGAGWTDTGLVFSQEDGTAYHPAHVTQRFERIAYGAGLPPIRLHDLRHGAATLALAAGADITEVSRMLRHSSIQITADIYTDVLPELAAETAAKVVRMIPRKGRRQDAI